MQLHHQQFRSALLCLCVHVHIPADDIPSSESCGIYPIFFSYFLADPWYIAYHDEEWGVPVHDDRSLPCSLSLSLSACTCACYNPDPDESRMML